LGLSAEEKGAWERLDYSGSMVWRMSWRWEPARRRFMELRILRSAWFLDQDILSYQLIARFFDGQSEGLTRGDVLDNITLTWLTNTAISSARLYWKNKLDFLAPKNVRIPVAVSAFPDEIWATQRNWAEKAYPNLIHYNEISKGGHFTAWEQPEIFVSEIRASFKLLRGSIWRLRRARMRVDPVTRGNINRNPEGIHQ